MIVCEGNGCTIPFYLHTLIVYTKQTPCNEHTQINGLIPTFLHQSVYLFPIAIYIGFSSLGVV